MSRRFAPKMPEIVPGSELWHKLRRTGLGGSDSAAALGISPWQTPYGLHLEKLGLSEPTPDDSPKRWGRLMEQPIRQEYAERTGREVRLPGFLRSQQHAWLIGNPDGDCGDRGLECKLDRWGRGFGAPGTDEVPIHYAAQVQHYMMLVPRWEAVDIAVPIGGWDFRIYTVPRNEEIQREIFAREEEFWRKHVVEGLPPPPITIGDAVRRWGKLARPGAVTADAEQLEMITAMHQARDYIKVATADFQRGKLQLIAALGEAGDSIVDADGKILATWKLGAGRKSYTVAEQPPARRFLLK